MQRHYGMDWLRIGAFLLLILYHIGMYFVHWGWHVQLPRPIEWVAIPMLATNSWRLALLFLVSGFASRMLFAKMPRAGSFAARRTARLLLPLVFGMALIVPPQPWAELVTQDGYAHGYGWFWLHDYFRFGDLGGIELPTWNHLWFVAYLWVYSLVLALCFAVPRGGGVIQRIFDRLFSSWAVLLIPIGWEMIQRLWLARGMEPSHNLTSDWVGHIAFVPPFVFGVLLAGSPRVMATLARLWKPAAALALIGYAGVAAVEWIYPGNSVPPRWVIDVFHAFRSVQAWAAIAALIGIADRFWNRDHRWRPMLTEAVFPFYIAHQTIIVVVAFWLMPTAIAPLAQFGILVAATVAGCWAFYLVGREITPLRPLIGLRLRRRERVAEGMPRDRPLPAT